MDISEQQLMDCSWGFGNNGCRGGYSWKALVWAKKHGVASSHSYGRYLAQVRSCQVNSTVYGLVKSSDEMLASIIICKTSTY